MNYVYEEDYLFHHGIKGQKWGKQNGPPYPLSKEKHNKVVKKSKKEKDRIKEMSDDELQNAIERLSLENRYIKLKAKENEKSINYVNQLLKTGKGITDSISKSDPTNTSKSISTILDSSSKIINNSSKSKKAISKYNLDLSNMSDDDLKKIVGRMNLEDRYSSLKAERIDTGRAKVSEIANVAGSIVGVAAGAAVLYKTLSSMKRKPKIGDSWGKIIK